MFDRFVLASNYNRIQSRYDMASLQEGETYIPSFNIVPDSGAYVIIPEHNIQPSLLPFSPSMQSYFEEKKPNISIRSFMFGLQGVERDTKYFIRAEGDRNINNDPNYTGSKAIFLQPKYKKIIREQRCLVLADAFIIGIEKPYLVYMRGKQRPFTFAGVWNKSADDKGPEINTFAIITIVANPLIRKLGHDRMPVILDN